MVRSLGSPPPSLPPPGTELSLTGGLTRAGREQPGSAGTVRPGGSSLGGPQLCSPLVTGGLLNTSMLWDPEQASSPRCPSTAQAPAHLLCTKPCSEPDGLAKGRAPPIPRAGQRHAAPRLIAPDSSPNCSHRVGAGPRHRRAPWRGRAGGLRGPPLCSWGSGAPCPLRAPGAMRPPGPSCSQGPRATSAACRGAPRAAPLRAGISASLLMCSGLMRLMRVSGAGMQPGPPSLAQPHSGAP